MRTSSIIMIMQRRLATRATLGTVAVVLALAACASHTRRPAATPAMMAAARASVPPGRTSVLVQMPGKTVEIIGLRRWTLAMLEDSLAKYAPGESLTSHACAAVLRYQLGFADAASTTRGPAPGDSIEYVVISLIEPQDSARVRYRQVALDTTAPFAPWREGIGLFERNGGALFTAVYRYLPSQRNPNVPLDAPTADDSAAVLAFEQFLRAHRTERDYRDAVQLLAQSPDYRTRTVAAAVLLNFVDRDSAIYALVEAVTQIEGPAKGVAGAVLTSYSFNARRPIRWQPVAPTVHAILNGTSLFELSNAIGWLTRFGVSPADARAFLHDGGGESLLAHVGAVDPYLREEAHRLLIALKGDDLGTDPARWRAWIATL